MTYPHAYHRALAGLIRTNDARTLRPLVAAALVALRRTRGRADARQALRHFAHVNPAFLR